MRHSCLHIGILTLIAVAFAPSLAFGDMVYSFENYSDPDTGYSIQGTIETVSGAHLDGLLTAGEILDMDLTITNGVSSHSWDENDPFTTTGVSISNSQIFLPRPPRPIGSSGTTATQFSAGTISDGADGELVWTWNRRGFTVDELFIQHRTLIVNDFDEDVTGLLSDPVTDVLVIATANAQAVPEPSSLAYCGMLLGMGAFYRHRRQRTVA